MAENKEKRFVSDNAQLMAEWNWTKNEELGITPTQVTYGSNKKVWWRCCECGNEWQATISNRVAGKGCPVCSKKKQGLSKVENLIKKVGSFAEHYPLLLEEWDYDKNTFSPFSTNMTDSV